MEENKQNQETKDPDRNISSGNSAQNPLESKLDAIRKILESESSDKKPVQTADPGKNQSAESQKQAEPSKDKTKQDDKRLFKINLKNLKTIFSIFGIVFCIILVVYAGFKYQGITGNIVKEDNNQIDSTNTTSDNGLAESDTNKTKNKLSEILNLNILKGIKLTDDKNTEENAEESNNEGKTKLSEELEKSSEDADNPETHAAQSSGILGFLKKHILGDVNLTKAPEEQTIDDNTEHEIYQSEEHPADSQTFSETITGFFKDRLLGDIKLTKEETAVNDSH